MASDRPGGEPTEEPTPRRLTQARDKGQIARSGDLTSGAAFLASVGALAAGGAWLSAAMTHIIRSGIARATQPGELAAGAALEQAARDILRVTLPILGAGFVVAAVVAGLQAGGLFTLGAIAPKGAKLNPLEGAKRIFSRKTAAELVKAVAKLALIVAIAWATLAPRVGDFPRLVGAPPALALHWAGALAMKLALRVAGAYVIVGAADYLWQRRRHLNELRMTREEVKREHKESEGDPRHKHERQRLHRDLLRHQMVEAVRTADCVIVNPDHIAVALKFDEDSMGAPQVVAKGERLIAEQIKDVARRYGVPIYRDVPLARALNELELGDEIPEALYEAVAEVLRFVYAQTKEQGP